MGIQRFFCYDLRSGIVGFGLFGLVLSSFAVVIHLILSMTEEDPEEATRQTFMTGANFLNLAVTGSMTYGAHKESRIFLIPFLIVDCIGLSILTIICVIFMFAVPILVLLLIILGFFWYIWLCVLTLYQILDPHNPNYVPKAIPSTDTVVYVDQPPNYYENNVAEVDAV